MILGICGLGFSGSGAVLDLLKEYPEIGGFSEREMSICYYPDGILDLDYHLNESYTRYMSSDAALYSFWRMMESRFAHSSRHQTEYDKRIIALTKQYIEDLTQVTWKGSWGYRDYIDAGIKQKINNAVLLRASLLIYKLFHKNVNLAKNGIMRLSIKPEHFDELTRNYLVEVLSCIGYTPKAEKFVVDQLFPGDNPEKCFKYFNDPYAIVVYRDPRDTYLLAKKMVKVHASWIPTDNVSDFIRYYKEIYGHARIGRTGRVLKVQYEDLIYKYEKTVAEIEQFCGLQNHTAVKKHFNPEYSIRYTQLIVDYPQYKSEIQQIERELKDYLYDFPYKREVIISNEAAIV